MHQIREEAKIEIIEKKSKFITRAKLVKTEDEAKKFIDEIRKKEKGAVHNCYAYRILSNKAIIERKNDDGEPGGTAGAPMLAMLIGEDMINTMVITTRYFGGIKLGTGGLVKVYKKGVKEVFKKSGKKEFEIYSKWRIIFSINKTDFVQNFLEKENICISEKIFAQEVNFIIEIPMQLEDKLKEIVNLINGKLIKE